jgi:hypothetical protein
MIIKVRWQCSKFSDTPGQRLFPKSHICLTGRVH